jgi:hypothetical protein
MKTWLCGITSSGNKHHFEEMIVPIINYFDGLVWTFHLPTDEGADFLEANKKGGEIIYANFSQRHGYSMTHFLWQGPMQDGDFFLVLDTMERISPEFCATALPNWIKTAKEQNVACISNYSKGFFYRYNEQLEFRGSPHWYHQNLDGNYGNVELSQDLFWHVRDKYRQPFQFVEHYVKYYLYPAGSNHALLGLEKNGDPQKLFPERENRRQAFRKYLRELGVPLTVEGVRSYMLKTKPLPARAKEFINSEKILNDAYRYWVVGDKSFIDDHDFKNMITV